MLVAFQPLPRIRGHAWIYFDIRCETCRARLRVRDERVLGQIHACPKCGSMVHIAAPAGWVMSSASEATLPGAAAAAPANLVRHANLPSSSICCSRAREPIAGLLAHLLHSPAVLWSAGGIVIALFGWSWRRFRLGMAVAKSIARPTQPTTTTAAQPRQPNSNPASGVCARSCCRDGRPIENRIPCRMRLKESPTLSRRRRDESSSDANLAGRRDCNTSRAPRTSRSVAESNQPGVTQPSNYQFIDVEPPRTLKLEPCRSTRRALPVADRADSMARARRNTRYLRVH